MGLDAVFLSVVGAVTAALGIVAVETFQLRQWKDPLYHLVAGTVVITVYQFLAAVGIVDGVIVQAVVDTTFAVLVAVGIYRIGVTAKTVGA